MYPLKFITISQSSVNIFEKETMLQQSVHARSCSDKK
jgi:hypothetical protein